MRSKIRGDRDLVVGLEGPSWMGREGMSGGGRDGRRKREGDFSAGGECVFGDVRRAKPSLFPRCLFGRRET